jgi:hypothetical protein
LLRYFPGSRSAPLAAAAARNPRARTLVTLMSGGPAFCALGYGRAANRPAALICTSGTAAANYLPAIIESSADTVPLLVADGRTAAGAARDRSQPGDPAAGPLGRQRPVGLRPRMSGRIDCAGGSADHYRSGGLSSLPRSIGPGPSELHVPRTAGACRYRRRFRRLSGKSRILAPCASAIHKVRDCA